MNEETLAAYERLLPFLDVDLINIDEHLVQLPMLQMEASERAADAALASTEAAQILKATMANAGAALRNAEGKKPPESQVAQDVLLDEDVMAAQNDANQAEHDKDKWRALVDAFKTKSSVLKTSADLINSGYLSPKTIVDSGRQSMNQKRADGWKPGQRQ
jgi:hypothetical protein